MREKVEELIGQMTLDEKIRFLSGKNFWVTVPFERLGISSMEVADGPYGLRKQEGISDHMGWNKSRPAVAYVSGPGMAASWDRELIREAGKHLGIEAKANGVDVLLGPAINIVRTPLCGRNFEYYSEDPCLTGKMAAAYIDGVQKQGVGTCIKHYAANNQEADREYIDAQVDERTLREIYLAAFEEPVKKAKPWSVMTALNKVNGSYCSEHSWLIDTVLRKEWGYEGFVMSDWSGVNNRARAVKAGLDLEMPNSNGIGDERVREGLDRGYLKEEDIDACCKRLLTAVLKSQKNRNPEAVWEEPKHHDFVRKLAEQCIILLKNEGDVLPLSPDGKIAVLGEFAKEPRFQMEGSALVNPTRFDIPLTEMEKHCHGEVSYVKGCSKEKEEHQRELEKAREAARLADIAVIMIGIPKGIEAEGCDRKNIDIPARYNELVEAVAEVQPNTVVVLQNGSPIAMPWLSKVKGVVECFLGGQAMGSALANVLFGQVNPSGKLPVTFPKALAHTPAYFNYPGQGGKVHYDEKVFVGYRYYDTKEIEPLFPFGHGLSYTTFAYSDMKLSSSHMTDQENLTVSLRVTNTGACDGAEIVQIYVKNPKGAVLRPNKELREFGKVYLKAGESRTLQFELEPRAFSYYDTELGCFYAPEGTYEILAAASSADVRLRKGLVFTPSYRKRKEVTGWSTIGDLKKTGAGRKMFEDIKDFLRASGKEQVLSLPLFDESEENRTRVEGLPLRMVTLLSENVLNNDVMDRFIEECNKGLN